MKTAGVYEFLGQPSYFTTSVKSFIFVGYNFCGLMRLLTYVELQFYKKFNFRPTD